MDVPPQNLYQAQPGPIGSEPIMPPIVQPQGYGQPIEPAVQPPVQPVIQPQPQPGYIPPGPQIVAQPPVPNQPIIVNQAIPVAPIKFKSEPMAIVCPICKNNITTVTQTQFNCANCCFCWFFCPLWCCVQLCSDKDLNCTDATHRCPQCGNVLGQYSAC